MGESRPYHSHNAESSDVRGDMALESGDESACSPSMLTMDGGLVESTGQRHCVTSRSLHRDLCCTDGMRYVFSPPKDGPVNSHNPSTRIA